MDNASSVQELLPCHVLLHCTYSVLKAIQDGPVASEVITKINTRTSVCMLPVLQAACKTVPHAAFPHTLSKRFLSSNEPEEMH